MIRFRCHLHGCRASDYDYFCVDCGAYRDGGAFIHLGLLESVQLWWMRTWASVRAVVWPRRCRACGCRLTRKQDIIGLCDKPKCWEGYVPF
jgi:hypothetical protein